MVWSVRLLTDAVRVLHSDKGIDLLAQDREEYMDKDDSIRLVLRPIELAQLHVLE
jgi:hypothetical protein